MVEAGTYSRAGLQATLGVEVPDAVTRGDGLTSERTERVFSPTIFGKLCLFERVSVGGMAEVYTARPFDAPNFDRLLAVKRILPNLEEEQEFVSMFIDEAKTSIQLNHPNICQMYELGRLGRSYYIVMEYIAGHDLSDVQAHYRTDAQQMPVGQAVFIGRAVAKALDHAHHQCDALGKPMGIVHRDVSPHNVLLSYAGDVKLIDFGIAKASHQSTETQVGVLKGKFSYMSPEQMRGGKLDGRSDQFALGIVLWELLTGKRLFRGESDLNTLELVREAQVQPLRELVPDLPEDLDKIILKALAKDRDDRYRTCEAFARALKRFADKQNWPFSRDALSQWMVERFADDLAAERRRREQYKSFQTAEDVVAFNERLVAEFREQVGAPALDEGEPELPDEELTHVAEADYAKLIEGIEPSSEPERREHTEIIAHNVEEDLEDLILKQKGTLLASIDLPELVEAELPAEVFQPRDRSYVWGRVVLVVFVVMALGFGAGTILLGQKTGPAPVTGMLRLSSTPAEDLAIFVDDIRIGDTSPRTVRDLAPGEHRLELRHPEYVGYRDSFTVQANRATDLNILLDPLVSARSAVRVTVSPAESTLFLDEVSFQATEWTVSGTRRHLLEARHPGFFSSAIWVTGTPGRSQEVRIVLEPATAEVQISVTPHATVLLDGEARGIAAPTLSLVDVDLRRQHILRFEPVGLGYQPLERTLVLEGTRAVQIIAALPRLGEDAPEDPFAAYGFLTFETGERWYHILVDGRPVGRTTPLRPNAPLPLRPGDREVTLMRANDQRTLTVSIAAGETTHMDCSQPGWSCRVQ